jgi:UDP-N-acetylglucosamine:LPS N-acetylglucosamine transferase
MPIAVAAHRALYVQRVAARVLIVSASIGEGHDLPARVLAEELGRRGATAEVIDGLDAAGRLATALAAGSSNFDSRLGNAFFDLGHRFVAEWRPTHRVAARLIRAIGHRGLLAAIARARPDVIVSTYPGATEILGDLRQRGRLAVPVLSAITDLASLRFWAHPGVDEHLTIHPESAAEVRAVAGPGAAVVAVHGLTGPGFRAPLAPAAARAALGLPVAGRLVVVSGGGWAVGDLGTAVDEALAAGARVVVLCGRRDEVRERLAARYAARRDVQVWGFTDRMPELLCAADVLVHSTAGLTMLEAMMCGCRPISFGWGQGHIRANNRAYARFGLAEVAPDRAALAAALAAGVSGRRPEPWQPDLPEAADRVLAQVASGWRT